MSHDHDGHDSCLRLKLIPLLHLDSLSVARGVTDVVVGSGALLGDMVRLQTLPSASDGAQGLNRSQAISTFTLFSIRRQSQDQTSDHHKPLRAFKLPHAPGGVKPLTTARPDAD